MSDKLKVHTMSDYFAEGKTPEVLFWIDVLVVLMIELKRLQKPL